MDYNDLLTTLGTRLNRADLASELPSFITRAEEIINARLARDPVRPMAATYSTDLDTAFVSIPDDIVELVDVRLSDGTETWRLVRLNPDDETDFYAKALPYGVMQRPDRIQHYYTFGDSLTLSGTPASGMSLTLKCYVKVPGLTSGNLTNWLIERHAVVYELGALAMAYRHLRDDEAAASKTDEFLSALEQVVEAYPERFNPTELRATDAPWANTSWNIIDG